MPQLPPVALTTLTLFSCVGARNHTRGTWHIADDPDESGSQCLLHARYHDAAPFFSQSKEDSALLRIFGCIGHGTREFFEFGAQDGMEVNTRLLREEFGWHGHYLDGGVANPALNLHHAFFNASNIVSLMTLHGASKHLDLLSIDCDFDDLFILREILLAHYKPRVLLVEYTGQFMLNQAYSVLAPRSVTDPRWQGDCYSGASALALARLASVFGYALVHAEAPNLYFVRLKVAKELGLDVPTKYSVLPSIPKSSMIIQSTTRCNECGAPWVRVPPTSMLRELATDPTMGPEDFAASLSMVTLAFRRVYKRFHLTGGSRGHHLHTPVFREISAPLVGAECTSWKLPVVAKPDPRTGRPDSARLHVN